jgi:flavin-binding protein dodecin
MSKKSLTKIDEEAVEKAADMLAQIMVAQVDAKNSANDEPKET